MQTQFKLRKIPNQWKDTSFGIEFECQYPNKKIRFALLHKYLGFFFCTTDGSLDREYGIEFVSQPLAPRVLIRKLEQMKKKWSEVRADQKGAIHIHVARSKKHTDAVNKIINWLYKVSPLQIRAFAGRYPNSFCEVWINPNTYHIERYSWINLQNPNTLEFRGFVNSGDHFGWDWAIICVKRLQYLLDNPTPQGMNEAIQKFPYNPLPQTNQATQTLGQQLRERLLYS